MALVVPACAKLLHYREDQRSKSMEKSRKSKAIIMARDGPGGFKGKELNHQIFTVGYFQFVGRKHVYAAPCSTGNGTSVVVRKPHRRPSMSGSEYTDGV
jgi:hypothetical protein